MTRTHRFLALIAVAAVTLSAGAAGTAAAPAASGDPAARPNVVFVLTDDLSWNQLPAVKANQLGDWSAEPRFSHQLATPVLRKLTEVVKAARTDVVA